MNAIIGHNGNAVLVARDGIGLSDFKNVIQVDDGLGNGVIVVIHAVGELSIIVEDKPPPLPSLGPVHWIGEVPVWRYKEVAALGHDPGGLVDLEGLIGVLVPVAVAVGALVLVEDVGLELAALVLPHDVSLC